MRQPVFWLIVVSLAIVAGATQALAERRVALVIGNSAYEHATPLKNPQNDANALAKVLGQLGFEVIKGVDLDRPQFESIVRKFARAVRGAEAALLFYAGHGLQVNGRNYLAPVDARLSDEADLEFETVRLETVLTQMEREAKTSLVFLDACRDNPLARNLARSMGTRSAAVGRGLARVETGVGTLISFATQPGNVALDGAGANSPFTAALLTHIETPDMDVALVMRRVREDVLKATSGQQVPWSNSSLTGAFAFAAKTSEVTPKRPPRAHDTGPAIGERAVELTYWNTIKDGTDVELFESYLKRFPKGAFVDLARIKIRKLKSKQKATLPAPAQKSPATRRGKPPEKHPGKPPAKTFAQPRLGRYRIDWCRVWGRQCGRPAADAFCQRQGFARASEFAIAHDIGGRAPTQIIGSGQLCDQRFCDGFHRIVCVR